MLMTFVQKLFKPRAPAPTKSEPLVYAPNDWDSAGCQAIAANDLLELQVALQTCQDPAVMFYGTAKAAAMAQAQPSDMFWLVYNHSEAVRDYLHRWLVFAAEGRNGELYDEILAHPGCDASKLDIADWNHSTAQWAALGATERVLRNITHPASQARSFKWFIRCAMLGRQRETVRALLLVYVKNTEMAKKPLEQYVRDWQRFVRLARRLGDYEMDWLLQLWEDLTLIFSQDLPSPESVSPPYARTRQHSKMTMLTKPAQRDDDPLTELGRLVARRAAKSSAWVPGADPTLQETETVLERMVGFRA